MKIQNQRFNKLASAMATVCLFSTSVMADSDAKFVLEEIIVTAQKRAESVQDVPISITAFDANKLSAAGILSTDDLGLVTPGMEMTRQLASAATFIRGVGTNNGSSGFEATVANYVDGVYVASPIMAVTAFNNIERIEVLKGPQGTLFGRNSTGGLVHIITKNPTFDNQFRIKASIDEYEVTDTSIYGSTGLTDTIAADLAVAIRRQGEGYGDNLAKGSDAGYMEHSMVRSKLFWQAADDTTVTLSASWGEKEADLGAGWACVKGSEATCIAGAAVSDDFHDINMNYGPVSKGEQQDYSVRIEHSFGNVDFMSLSAYSKSDSTDYADQDAGPFPIIDVIQWGGAENYSQEFQLQSAYESDLQWILGAFYFDSDAGREPTSLAGQGLPLLFPGLQSLLGYSAIATESLAFFAQGTYTFTDNTNLTLGVRWTRDKREVSGKNFLTFGGVGTIPVDLGSESKTYTEPTWRIAVDHSFSEDIMGYVSYNRGFKSGNFDAVLFTKATIPEPVQPEILDAYEVGFKGDFMNSRLRLNASAFYYDYTDLQFSRVIAGGSTFLNAAEAEIKGFELEGEGLLTDRLRVNFGVSFLDTEYTSFPDCPQRGGSKDCTGNDLMRSPDFTYNLGVNYEIPVTSGLITINATLAYNDGFYWEPNNNLEEDDYSILNSSIAWSSDSGKYTVSLYGRNLLDEEYSVWTQQSDFGDVYSAAAPRVVGLGVDINFF